MTYFTELNLLKELPSLNIQANINCEQGSFTCIVGPSGSGKSTLLRLISGLEKSDSQQTKIILDNNDITHISPAKRNIGMVFQNGNLFEHMTVVQNVAYGLISHGVKKKKALQLAKDFLPLFEIENLYDRYPETLSGGESQRVALARTLITRPKLVLFDEPLSALDAPLRKKLALLIKDLQNSFNFTSIMVTHDLEEAKNMADRIILIKKGSIYWQGNSDDFTEELF